jgi:GTPase SAR1 family protein
MEEREPKLGVAVGRKGCGKTYTTKRMLQQYVQGNPEKGVQARRVLILDVNDEYEDIKALKISDVQKFSMHPKIEIRRIRPFYDNGTRMTINDVQETLFKILFDFRNGLLLIEDINRYISDYLPNDLVGAIVTNRHTDTDIILHFQSIGRVSPKIWQNLNWMRFHKNTDSVDKHRNKFEDKYEMFKIVELYTNKEYHEYDNQRIFVYVDIDDEKIKGADRKKLEPIIDEYISHNYRKLITPMLQQKDLIGGKKKFTPADAVKFHKERILKYYL